jgi:predicted sulfurtransferase
MTLRIGAERWCECVISPDSIRNRPLRCGNVAISLCDSCGVPLCESHEILCHNCSSVTCLNCDHACAVKVQNLPMEAA